MAEAGLLLSSKFRPEFSPLGEGRPQAKEIIITTYLVPSVSVTQQCWMLTLTPYVAPSVDVTHLCRLLILIVPLRFHPQATKLHCGFLLFVLFTLRKEVTMELCSAGGQTSC